MDSRRRRRKMRGKRREIYCFTAQNHNAACCVEDNERATEAGECRRNICITPMWTYSRSRLSRNRNAME